MTARPTVEQWDILTAAHQGVLIEVLRPMLEGDGRIELDPGTLAQRASATSIGAAAILQDLQQMGILDLRHRTSCGCCGSPLAEEETTEELCVHCGQALIDCGVARTSVYVRDAERARDVRWMLVVHGMNTSGEWQEHLSWLCGTTHQRSLPVFIYKYGKVRPGVFIKWRQHRLTRTLAKKIQLLTEEYGLGDNGPDVIAHSFGTWLIGHVLLMNLSVKVGRVILAGSILRPDFSWAPLIERGQVGAVLNHCAAKDRWVPLAHAVIPDAGPSGTQGFMDGATIHRKESTYGHSTFFDEEAMEGIYKDVWDIFLKRPATRLGELRRGEPTDSWLALPLVLRELARFLVLGVILVSALVLVLSSIVGFKEISGWL